MFAEARSLLSLHPLFLQWKATRQRCLVSMVFWENKEEEAVFALGMMWDEEKEQPKRLDLRIQQKQKIIEKHKLQGSQKMLANETRFPAVCDGDVVTPAASGAWDHSDSWHLNCLSKVGVFLMPQTYMRKITVILIFPNGFQDYILWTWRNPVSLALISGAYGRWGLHWAMRTIYSCCRSCPLTSLQSPVHTDCC